MVELRHAAPTDAHAIATVHLRSWQEAYRGLLHDDVLASLSVSSRAQRWFDILSDPQPRTRTVVTTTGTTVLGFASTGPARDIKDRDPAAGELYAIYLTPEVWGRGIGVRLHAHALQQLRVLGFDQADLWVLEGNERALRFYHREGWADTGRSKLGRGPTDVELAERQLNRPLTAD
jgi:GNAT superfamily N-acetyltransferase